MTTRQRLISLGLIKPHTADNRAASMAKAIASRRRETGNVISITTKRSINISHGRTSA